MEDLLEKQQIKPEQNSKPPKYARVRNTLRATYDRETILPIIDTALIAHVGFLAEDRPMVIPMAFARINDTLYIHAAKAARIVKSMGDEAPVCLTFTHVDGLVVARSAFHHSANYRCAVIHGTARLVADKQEAYDALKAITEHLLPDRWQEVRPMTEKEQKSTGVIAISIDHASAKVRGGAPVDDDEDYAQPYWAGVVPITTALGQPLDDGRVLQGISCPSSIAKARQKFA